MIIQEMLENGYVKTYSDQEGYLVRNIQNRDTFLEAIDDPAWGCKYDEYKPEDKEKEVNL